MSKTKAKKDLVKSIAHIFFQHKGGIGKSTLASYFAEFKRYRGDDAALYDADPMNQSFAAYEGLQVKEVDLMLNDEVAKLKVDAFMEEMFFIKDDRPDVEFIIDVGASSYPALSKYFKENAVFDVLKDEGVTPYIHCPMVGGDMYKHTAVGFGSLASRFPSTKIVLWNNLYFGEIADADSIPFESTMLYQKHQHLIHAVVDTPHVDADDIKVKTQNSLLFNECTTNHFNRMQLRRINSYWKHLFENIDAAGI